MNIKEILEAVHAFEIQSANDLENFRIQFLGSKGQIKDLYGALKAFPMRKKGLLDNKSMKYDNSLKIN